MGDSAESNLMDDLAEAWDATEEDVSDAEDQQPEPAEQPAELGAAESGPEEQDGDDPDGGVVSGAADEDQPGGVEDTADAESPPVGLSPQAREDWKNTPESVRKELAKREADFEKGIVQYSQNAKRAEMMDKTLAPYSQLFAINGGAANTLPGLLQTASQLQMGAPQQKAQTIANLIKQFGVDIRTLDTLLVGEKPPVDPNQQISELVEQRFQQENQRRQQYEMQQTQQRIGEQIHEFASNPKHEFYNDVKMDMADLIDMAAKRGQTMNMEQAYEKAILMHPQISQIISARKSQGDLQSKRRAASSVSGSMGGPGGHAEPDSTRAAIEDAWNRAGQI